MRGKAAALFALALVAPPASAAAPDLGTEAQRAEGKKIYDKYCSQCHGETGDGAGVAAAHLSPPPRNFTTGKYKIRTTPSGALPTTEDLRQVIRRGMPYTSMPAWPGLTDDQLSSLAYHLKTFSPDFANPELAPVAVELPKAPGYSKESAELGRKVYEETGCISCHGELGRGDGSSAATLADDLGNPLRPADFTQRWTFRGGPSREDIFRTMTTGLNGTPMPAFGDALTAEQRWAITDYVYSLGEADAPAYASLVTARHLDDTIDVAKGAAMFEQAPVARFPIVGQIMEPGRAFHPAAVSIRVQAVYDGQDIAFLLRWNDMSAETSGRNAPDLAVPASEEEGRAPAPSGGGEGDVWGDAAETAPPPADDPRGEAGGSSAPSASEFSDAVAIQLPTQIPTGARKPYFLFGDAGSPVDLWFVDLARGRAQQYVARGSGAVERSDAGEVEASAAYKDGEWSVVLKRRLRSGGGVPFAQGEFVPIAFSVWDGFGRERGSRRGLTSWFHLYVEPERVESAWGPMLRAGLSVLAAELLIVFLVRRGRRRAAPAALGEPAASSS